MFHVEHFYSVSRLLILAFWIVTISSCDKENPNPEVLDTVLSALSSQKVDTQRDLDKAIKQRDDTEASLSSHAPNTLDLKLAKRDWLKAQAEVDRLRQQLAYLDIKLRRRVAEDRLRYRLARQKGESWPDPNELNHYKINQKLGSAPLNWNNRVPKLVDRIPTSIETTKK